MSQIPISAGAAYDITPPKFGETQVTVVDGLVKASRNGTLGTEILSAGQSRTFDGQPSFTALVDSVLQVDHIVENPPKTVDDPDVPAVLEDQPDDPAGPDTPADDTP